jgi:hypothetical protein
MLAVVLLSLSQFVTICVRNRSVSVTQRAPVVDLMLVVNGDFAFVEIGEGLYLFLIGKLL